MNVHARKTLTDVIDLIDSLGHTRCIIRVSELLERLTESEERQPSVGLMLDAGGNVRFTDNRDQANYWLIKQPDCFLIYG